jgi:hypothetical protein
MNFYREILIMLLAGTAWATMLVGVIYDPPWLLPGMAVSITCLLTAILYRLLNMKA